MAVVGDNANYTGKTGACEPFTVNKKQLDITTTVHTDSPDAALAGNLPLGGGAHDSATVSGKVDSKTLPNVTFYFFGNGVACTDGSTTGGTALNTIAPDGTTSIAHPSTSQTNLDAVTDNFMAVVVDNANYPGKTAACDPFTALLRSLDITTTVHTDSPDAALAGNLPLGGGAHDSATVSGKVD